MGLELLVGAWGPSIKSSRPPPSLPPSKIFAPARTGAIRERKIPANLLIGGWKLEHSLAHKTVCTNHNKDQNICFLNKNIAAKSFYSGKQPHFNNLTFTNRFLNFYVKLYRHFPLSRTVHYFGHLLIFAIQWNPFPSQNRFNEFI